MTIRGDFEALLLPYMKPQEARNIAGQFFSSLTDGDAIDVLRQAGADEADLAAFFWCVRTLKAKMLTHRGKP